MSDNIAASMTASIVIDKNDLLAQILKGLSEGQKELENNKLELFFDFSNSKNKNEFEKIIQKYRKELSSEDLIIQIKNQGIEETIKSLDRLVEVVKSIASGKSFGVGLGNGIGNSVIDEKKLDSIIDLFTKMETHLLSIKKVLSDVGEGEEFSPLFNVINKIDSSITQLSSKVGNIGLNMNIDFGSDKELEAKAEAKISNALQAYQRLFEHLKLSSVGGSYINNKFFDFDINQFDTPMSKLQAYRKFIENMRIETKQMFNGQDILYTDTDKKYWNQASAAYGQVTRVFNEMNAASDVNPLENIFGKTDLSGVIEQLNTIVSKLDEISESAKGLTEAFKDGLNVNASVEEIEKLTNRVKELEDELAKVKTPTVATAQQESNIPSDISSQVKISDNITEQIVSNEKKKQEAYKATAETVMYHAGTLSKLNKAETNGRFYGSNRGTGYFGTGHYFVDSNSKHYLDESSTYSKLPYSSIDISQYDNLFKANNDTIAKSLHEFLKNLTRYTQGDTKFNISELFSQFENIFGNTVMDIKEFESRINGLKDFMSKSNLGDRSDSVSTQFMKSLGYGGVDTRGTRFADIEYGTVIYDLKEESVLQANVTDELQKQGQMLEKINYEKGQVFDSSEDSRLQDIINQQEKGKAIREEYNKIYDDTKLDSYSTELSEINKKLDENDEIIGNCRLGIENAEKEAQQFAKEMKELGIEMSNEEIQNSAIESQKSYQERIDELEKERPLLEARRQELEANLDAESKLSKAAMERATATVEDRMKDAFPSTEATASVEKTTQAIKEENNALEETANKAKQAVSELVKGRDIVSQNWYREKGTVIGKDSNGNAITRDADEFSFVERLKNGQLQTVLATYNEETGKWAEQIIDVRTAFEQVEKAIISADNKIASLEMAKEKTLAAHPGYDATADDNQIAIERKKRDELQNTLNLYGQEKEYVFDIEAANKRIADNQERLNNKKQSQTNLRQTVSEEQFSKDWDAAIAENNKREATRQKSIEQTNRLLNKQQIIIDGIEKAYSKAANPDLDKGVDSQSDLIELANKKAEIQTLLNKLSGQDRNSSNEKEFLQVEKLVAEYKQLAKDKLKANNPSKQELGGQKLDVLLANQVMQYNKLISQSEKYGDATKEITDELKAQRDLIAEQDKNGIYVARSKKADGSEITANDYYKARDNYKIDKSIFNSYENNIKANNQAAKEQNKILREKIELGKQSKGLERKTAESERQSAVNQALKDQLEAWKQIQRIRKEIAGTSNTNIIQQLEQEKKSYQKQFNVATKILKNNSDLYNSEQHINKLKEITLKTTRQIESAQRRQLNGYDKKLSSYNSKTAGYDATIDRFENGGWTSPEYLQNVEAAKKKLKEYEDEISKLKNDPELINKDSLARVKQLGEEFEELTSQIQNMSAAQKGYSLVSGQKELDKIRQILKENSAMSAEAKGKIKAYYREIESGNPSMSLDKIHGEIMKIVNAEAEAGRAGKRMWDVIKEKAWYGAANVIGTYFGVNDIFRYIQQGIGTVREFDTALTEMRKVSDESVQSLKNYQSTTFDTANAVGTTAKQIQESTADYMRLGESLDEASESAKTANILLNVSEFDNIEDATKSLVAMGQAYKDLDKMTIVDKLNEVGNNYAISTDELSTALQKSAATLSLMGNTIDEAASLVTTANATIQDADSVSAGLRTISLRLVGTEEAEEELSAMNEEVDAFVKSTNSKKQQIIKDYTAVASNNYQGFDILDSNGNYKNTYQILLGIAKVYKEIQEQDKKLGTNHATALIEELAGKNRSNIASAILQDPTQLEAVKKSSEEAMGSAQKELNSYLDSIDGKMAQLENRAQEFWVKVINSDAIKNGIDLLSTLLKNVTGFVDKVGLLPTIFTGVGAALSFKNVGINTLVAY